MKCVQVVGIQVFFYILGGSISSLLYLKLFKAFDGMEGRELTQPELINITFGAPLFGNYVMEEDFQRIP